MDKKNKTYPIAFLTKAGCFFLKHKTELSADGTPRYIHNPNSDATYCLDHCLNDYHPIYSKKELDTITEVIHRLKIGDKFSGKNGAFDGTIMASLFGTNEIFVNLEKDGCYWSEKWDLKYVVWGFERGDYYFLED